MTTMNIVRFQPFAEFDRVANHVAKRSFNQEFKPFSEFERVSNDATRQVTTHLDTMFNAFNANVGEFFSNTGLNNNFSERFGNSFNRMPKAWAEGTFFGNALANTLLNGFSLAGGSFVPRVDASEDEKTISLQVELPGLGKEDLSVTVSEDRVLTVKGEKKRDEKAEPDTKSVVRAERFYGKFERSFALPENVNAEKVGATFENGLLTLTLDKVEAPKAKEIAVKIK